MFDAHGYFTGELPPECVDDCTRPGQKADDAVAYWREKLNFIVPRDLALRWLYESGAHTREEWQAMDNIELADCVLWMACGEVKDNDGEPWLGLVS